MIKQNHNEIILADELQRHFHWAGTFLFTKCPQLGNTIRRVQFYTSSRPTEMLAGIFPAAKLPIQYE